MIVSILILIIGFAILIKGADLFVDSASSLAQNFKLSKTLIALTIVAFGTSAPELGVSIKAILSGSGEIVLGNVIGSNILNILLIIGVSSLCHPLSVRNNTIKKELPFMLLVTILLSVLISDSVFDANQINVFSREDGFVLLIFFAVFVYYLISMIRNKVDEESEPSKYSLKKSIIYTILGLIAIVIGSNFVVESAIEIATILGISERMISLTIIALGTSLPELVTSLTATSKGEYDIALGNAVGSNICNIGIVLGLPVAIFGGFGNITFNLIDIITLISSAFLLFIFAFHDRNINKREGLMLFIVFIIYYASLFII